jgi:hypothetical protein
MKQLLIVTLVLSLALMPLFGQSESVKKRFQLEPDKPASLYFKDIDGDVKVVKHDKREIIFEFVKELKGSASAKNREYFDGIRPEISFKDNILTIEIKYPKKHFKLFSFSSVKIKAKSSLMVPRQTDAKIRLVDGDVWTSGLVGHLDLKSVDGDLYVKACEGQLKLHTVDGEIEVNGGGGTLDTYTVDGDVTADGVFSEILFKSVDGEGTFGLKPGSVLKGDCSLRSVDGGIRLSYPQELGFKVNAKTGDGGIDVHSKFDTITLKKRNRFSGQRGDARFTVTITTVDGGISLKEH